MPRFFKTDIAQSPTLMGEDAKHIVRSLRMRAGEHITVCDTLGTDYDCSIVTAEPDLVTLQIEHTHPTLSEPDIAVTLCTSLLKSDKLEQVLRHAVELGMGEFIPVLSTNCVSRPDDKALTSKLARWQKIADEAAGQSGRGKLPQVQPVCSLTALAKRLSEFDLVLFFYEGGGAPLGETIWENDKAKSIALITGPEGGFTKEEAELLAQAGAKTVSLGKRILRAETAPLAALTGVMLLTDNLE